MPDQGETSHDDAESTQLSLIEIAADKPSAADSEQPPVKHGNVAAPQDPCLASNDDEDQEDEEDEDEEDKSMERALLLYMQKLGGLSLTDASQELARCEKLLSSFNLHGVAQYIKDGKAKNIICMCGAGISVSAGIPDFRSPGTGLYSQLAKYNLPRPEAVFSIDFFQQNPGPFQMLAKELFPGKYKPTATHFFMSLLHRKGLLLRCFTQNIDSLESLAGLPKEKVVAAHGNFDGAHCINPSCKREHDVKVVEAAIMQGELCKCTHCGSLVKPDIVFFGEQLPMRFFSLKEEDFPKCDLLVVLGTSLVVHPFAGLIHSVQLDVPRLLVNKEKVGQAPEGLGCFQSSSTYFKFDEDANYRDALWLGDCDEGIWELVRLLGWDQELKELIADGQSKL